jgi:hypothetical protein
MLRSKNLEGLTPLRYMADGSRWASPRFYDLPTNCPRTTTAVGGGGTHWAQSGSKWRDRKGKETGSYRYVCVCLIGARLSVTSACPIRRGGGVDKVRAWKKNLIKDHMTSASGYRADELSNRLNKQVSEVNCKVKTGETAACFRQAHWLLRVRSNYVQEWGIGETEND